MIDSRVSQTLKIEDDTRSIEVDLPADSDGLTLSMRMGEQGERGYQFIYYGLTRRQALIIGQFLTEYGNSVSAVDAGMKGTPQ